MFFRGSSEESYSAEEKMAKDEFGKNIVLTEFEKRMGNNTEKRLSQLI